MLRQCLLRWSSYFPPCSSIVSQQTLCGFSTLAQAAASIPTPVHQTGASHLESGLRSSDSTTSSAASTSGRPLPLGTPKPDLVEKFLSVQNQSGAGRLKSQVWNLVQQVQRHTEDVGSPEVAVAVWTHKMRTLARELKHQKKDHQKMRDLEMMMARRRRMLIWMRREHFEQYAYTVARLGLKDVFTDMRMNDRYRVGTKFGDPADDRVLRRLYNCQTKYGKKKTSQWLRLKPLLKDEDPWISVD